MTFGQTNSYVELQKKGSDSESFDDDDDFEKSFNASPPKRETTSRRAATKVNTSDLNATFRFAIYYIVIRFVCLESELRRIE